MRGNPFILITVSVFEYELASQLGAGPSPQLARTVGRTLHRYCRGHGFKSCTGLIFFQALFLLLLKLCSLLQRSLSYSRLYLQPTYMIFIYSQSSINILHTVLQTFPKELTRRICQEFL